MKKKKIIIEFFILFLLSPFFFYYFRLQFKSLLFVAAGLGVLYSINILFRDKTFAKEKLTSICDLSKHLKPIIVRFFIGGSVLSFLVWFFDESLFLNFPKQNPSVYLLVMIMYPLISVYPQELIFRVFFFHRYKNLFQNKFVLIIINGLCFGLAHLFFGNYLAVIMSTIGGIMFAHTYHKTSSIIPVVIEHALWGDLIFTIGLGQYFYSGAIS